MRITEVEAIHLRLPQVEERCDGTQDALIVKLYTDSGIVGIGEVDSSPHVIKAIIEAPTSHALCYGLRDLIIGEDPFEIERLWNKMYQGSIYYGRRGAAIQAMSGIDIALWDIVGKATNQPIYKLLGGAYHKRLKIYASSLFGDTPDETQSRAQEFAKLGFKAVKFGWGPLGKDPKFDLELVQAARSGIGEENDLMVDAGFAWEASTAIQMAKKFEKYNIFWLEEPLHPDDLHGYAKLSKAVEVRIAAGEEETGRYAFRELIEVGKVDVIQPDVARAGGLTESKRIAQIAAEYGVVVASHAFTTGINLAASMHLLASIPNALYLEYCMANSPLRGELTLPSNFPITDGYVEIPETAGLGVELDEKVIERYRV